MSAIQQALMAANFTTPTYTTWNPSNKAASITLSGGDLTATTSTSNGKVFSIASVPTDGRRYFEFLIGGTAGQHFVGVANASSNTTVFPGDTGDSSNSIGYWANDGDLYKNGVAVATSVYTYTTGDVIGVAVDGIARTVAFYKNNTIALSYASPPTGALYAVFGTNGYTGRSVTARFNPASMSYSPPGEFIAGLF